MKTEDKFKELDQKIAEGFQVARHTVNRATEMERPVRRLIDAILRLMRLLKKKGS